MGRRKVAALRGLAASQGGLAPEAPLPDDAALSAAIGQARRARSTISTVEPHRAQAERWAAEGVGGIAIHAALRRDHGYRGSYSAVRRMMAAIRAGLPPEATVRLEFPAAEAAQVDFGAGPVLLGLARGESRRTWSFVMTLCYSRHQYVEFVLDKTVMTWLGCHRRAFEWFGAIPTRVIIDNLKCAITRACVRDPVVQRASGILDSLDARNRQAIDSKLAYTEFLALLIQDEIARRDQKKFTTRLHRASFRTNKTLDQFDFDRLPKLNRALVHDLATGHYLAEYAPVLIVGQLGVGKSHLAQALGHCAIRQGIDVLFSSCSQLTATLNAARAAGGYERKLATLAHVPLLVIDDFGLKPLRSPADEDLHDLIAERYEQASTIVTSNLDFDEWDQAFPSNRLLASATVDRLRP